MKELNIIQTKLVSNKDKHNGFGNFDYRSLETILSALKPLLAETKTTITFSDELLLIGNRYYIKSTCTLKNEAGEIENAVAYAREQDQKRGMDEAQVTGSASSYARKYAACSLLGISDGFDPDVLDNRSEGQKKAPQKQRGPQGINTPDEAIMALQTAKNKQELDSIWQTIGAFQNNIDCLNVANTLFNSLP